VKHQIAKKF